MDNLGEERFVKLYKWFENKTTLKIGNALCEVTQMLYREKIVL